VLFRSGLGRFSFRPKSPQKGWGLLKHDFRLTERLLPDSTMTYRGRSDGLVVESDRKKIITFKFTCCHLRDLQGYCVYTSGGFFFSFPPRQCVAPISLMDKPPLILILQEYRNHPVLHMCDAIEIVIETVIC